METGGAAERPWQRPGPGRGDPKGAAGCDPGHRCDPQPGHPLPPPSGLVRCCRPGGAPPEPRSDWVPPETPPWRGDPRAAGGGEGGATAAPQRLRLINTLTGEEHVIEAGGCRGGALVARALPWNAHAGGYAWRCGGAPLHPEDPPPHPDIGDDDDDSPPTALLYFTDDFAEK